ncbi:hypothetical protein AB0C51_03500 [Streptomyces pathocidini]|uniref:hypothetical protein n=1 Tax=Streptomyces pathocidini TaxID=1650571 RepID=UPI00340C01BE
MNHQDYDGNEFTFATALLRSHPETAQAYELAGRLRGLLPINSLDALEKGLNGQPLAFGNGEVPLSAIEPHLPERVFPVTDEADLATKLTAAVRTARAQTLRRTSTDSPPSGVFTGPSLLGGVKVPETTRTRQALDWVVTLELRDCQTLALLPYAWIFDGVYTYQFDMNGQFIAVIQGGWENYSVAISREGYLNRLVVLTQSTMAGTTQQICLNPAG